jgi:Flp pilus assembly protein TadD
MTMPQVAENSSPAQAFAAARAALDALPSSHRVTSDEAEAIYAMVHTAIVQGQHETALRYLALLTFLKPTEPRYLGALALTYKQVGLTTEALKVYCFLALLEPAELLHPLAVAECHLLLQEPQRAEPVLNFVIDSCRGVEGVEKLAARAQALLDLMGPARAAEHATA